MTDIIKSLGCMEDMSQGIDSENQVRNGVSYNVRQLPIPYPVANEVEITALDVNTYILARLFTGDTAKEYIYKEFDLTGIPSTGAGTWIPLLSDGVGDLAIIAGAVYVSDTEFIVLSDYTLELIPGTYTTLTTDVGGIAKATVVSSSFDGTNTLVTVLEEVVTPNLASVTISNYAEVLRKVIDDFNDEGTAVIDAIQDIADTQLADQSASFQNRFAFSRPTLPWEPLTLIADELQLYSTGTIGESGYSVWLADPNLLPFTTSATFAEDEALGRWQVATVATQDWSKVNFKQSIDTVAEIAGLDTAIGNKVFWAGYHSVGDGGSNWGIVKSGVHTADGGSIFTIDATTYIEADLKGKSINVRKFGATGDAVTDDSPSFQAAWDYAYLVQTSLRGERGSTIFVPDGDYIINTRIFSTSDTTNIDVRIGFRGESQDCTRIIVNNQFGFLRWVKTNYGLFFSAKDLTFLAKYGTTIAVDDTASGTCIELEQYHSGNRRDRHYYFENVNIGPYSGATGDHFFRGVFCTGGGRLYGKNIYVWGKTSGDRPDTWLGNTGIYMEDVYGFKLKDSGTWGFLTGFRSTSTRDPGPEGGTIEGCTFDAQRGIYVETPSVYGEPQFNVFKTHCNYGTVGIEITNRKFVKIEDCLIYCEMTTGSTYYDILLSNVSNSDLRRNTHSYDVTGTRYHIRIVGGIYESASNTIADCRFLGNATRAISVGTANVRNTTLAGNFYSSTLSGWWISNGNGTWMSPTEITYYGAPEGSSQGAPVGSRYFRTNGGAGITLYIKETGDATTNTGWVAK